MRNLGKLWNWAAAISLLVLVLITIAAVVMRYVFNAPLQWTEEMSGLLMIWIVMFGAIAAERENQHLTIPLLPEAMPPRWGAALNMVTAAASISVLVYMAYLAYGLSMRAQYKLTQILQISWFWIDIAVTVGCSVMAVYTLMRVYRHFRECAGEATPKETLSVQDATIGDGR